MKGVITNFRSVQSHADGTSDGSVYTVCIDKLLQELQRRFRDFDFTQFSVSFNTNPFQERDISGVLKVCLQCWSNTEKDTRLLRNKQTLPLQATANDSVHYFNADDLLSLTEKNVSTGECTLRLYIINRVSVFNTGRAAVKPRLSLSDRQLNSCMRVAITTHAPKFNRLVYELLWQVSKWIP